MKKKSKYGLETTNYEGLFAKRKGTSKGEYANIETACVLLDRIAEFTFTFETGWGKVRLLEDYIKNNTNIDKEKISRLSKGLINKVKLNKLLNNLSPWEAEYFVNMVYELVDASGVESVDNLFKVKVLIEAYKKYKALDPDNSLVLKDILKRLVKSIFK